GGHVAERRPQRRAIQEGRNEHEKDELRVELHRGKPGHQGDEQSARDEHGGRGDVQPARQQREQGDADEQREDGLESVHSVWASQSYLPAWRSPPSCSTSTAPSSTRS